MRQSASKHTVPLQTIVRSARPPIVREAACPIRKVQDGSHFARTRDAGRRDVRLASRRRRWHARRAAQEPGPAAAAPSYAELVPAEETAQPPAQPVNLSTWSGRTEVYPIGRVIMESIFGKPDPDTWRPLPCSTLFSEGWHEPWVPSPNGSGGAPDRAGSMPRTATCTGCGSSRSPRRSTRPRRATPTSVPTRSSRPSAVAWS